jgi:branched-chain amino acid transport system ATP-binding protein
MTAVLEIEQLSLRFGGIVALDNVSLSVAVGDLLAIVGPNGAGKTSLLNCVTGAYRPTHGRIAFEGADITRAAAHTAAKRGIARTFQHNELFPQLTTLENLLLGRHAALGYGLISAALYLGPCRKWEIEQRDRIEAVIEFFELEPYRKRAVGDLPYGVQKVIGLARVFANDPRLILLDEPSAGLNRQEKEDVARYLLRVRHDFSPTIVWIEHDMQLVRDLADRVFVLHYGSKLASGTPEQVLSDPRVIDAYLGHHRGANAQVPALETRK